ncbi:MULTISPECIES: xylulokinase [unclassified Curtobacterium]|uniref:xylulokinase n=1 Tax=unclassified Curtobacterium TaxID=257496 RepID=UPI000F499BB9|nr:MULTISPECIES: FGGY family carbohydrate kinase [unclassified Curtobacterium]ROQ17375.1 xylulokinase [Curtobacterium sp. PhB171]ROQ29380.1 xylulokinase [Curtobacterium sp. PhB170]ROS45474.1 xylulokinase [Curtobacterium sp. PhB131]ROS65818.1 xylulokinase [Curtobacterium sp. PhB141]
MTQLVAGVDSSTQSCKVTIRDAATGAVVREGRAAHPDGTSVDPRRWWGALGTAVADAGGLTDVGAVAIAGQQHGMVALDADGHVVRDALLWNDVRSADAAAQMVEEIGRESWVARTGLVPVASFTGTKLRWLRDAEPDNAGRVAAVALPHDWLSWRLRGYGPADESPLGPDLDALATDASDASGTAYWDPVRREYDPDLFELALGRPMRVAGSEPTADTVVVPRVVAHDEAMGTLDVEVALPNGAVAPAGLVVAAGLGDNAGAALGLGLAPGDIAVSLGTSGTVFGVTATEVLDPSGTVAGFADGTGSRLPIVTTLNAARVLEVIGGLLGVDHDALGELALQAPAGADGLVLVPYFVGERTPNRPDATASLLGMTPGTTDRPHLARAAVEGMLCALADGLAAVEETGVTVSRLLLIGGAARNEAVRTVAAQVFGRDVLIPEPGEYVASGAARQAAWALTGALPSWDIATTTVPADPHPEVLEQYRAAAR